MSGRERKYAHRIRSLPDPRSPAARLVSDAVTATRIRTVKGPLMATFLVFRHLPGVTRDQYAAAQQAAMDVASQSSAHGHAVRYLGGFFIPDKSEAICIFDGDSADDIAAVNQHAGIPFTEVREAIEMQPRPGISPLFSGTAPASGSGRRSR